MMYSTLMYIIYIYNIIICKQTLWVQHSETNKYLHAEISRPICGSFSAPSGNPHEIARKNCCCMLLFWFVKTCGNHGTNATKTEVLWGFNFFMAWKLIQLNGRFSSKPCFIVRRRFGFCLDHHGLNHSWSPMLGWSLKLTAICWTVPQLYIANKYYNVIILYQKST